MRFNFFHHFDPIAFPRRVSRMNLQTLLGDSSWNRGPVNPFPPMGMVINFCKKRNAVNKWLEVELHLSQFSYIIAHFEV